MRAWFWLGTVSLALACGGRDVAGVDVAEPEIPFVTAPGVEGVSSSALTVFTGANACGDLEKHIQDRAVDEMKRLLSSNQSYAKSVWKCSAQSIQSGGSGGCPWGTWSSIDAGIAAGPSAPSAFSTTNVQTAQVDEPDLMKNDGTRIFVLSGRTLYAVRSWPPQAMAAVGTLRFQGRPHEMFLEGQRLVVVSRLDVPAADGGYGGFGESTEVSHVDVSDLARPTVVATHRVAGAYVSARRVGASVRVVTQSRLPTVSNLKTTMRYEAIIAAVSEAEVDATFAAMATENEVRLRATPYTFWFPKLGGDCTGVVAPKVPAPLGVVSVSTFDVAKPTSVSTLSMVAQVDFLYASPTSLYLGNRSWSSNAAAPATNITWLYKFDTSDASRVSFVAHGRVDGAPLNSYALDEAQGFLRMAVSSTGLTGARSRQNRVVVLEARQGVLTEVGRTQSFADGEEVKSVRFAGDRAYVVTYLVTDPLFVIDLSNPSRPAVVGELKVPGFSTYLHPVGANHLIGVGTYIPDGAPQWSSQRKIQVALFDVSDPKAPKQTAKHLIGDSASFSEAQWESRAFTYLPQSNLLAMPFHSSKWTWVGNVGSHAFTSRLDVLFVDWVAGFLPVGSLPVNDLLDPLCKANSGWCGWGWHWSPGVRRAVIADDFVYAITTGGIRVAKLNALHQPVATVPFAPSP